MTTQETAVEIVPKAASTPVDRRSLMREMAARFGMEPGPFQETLMATVMPKNTSLESVAAFLVVAREHNLNPFLREIMAFESNGGVRPMVPIDGWANIVNRQANYDGCELIEIFDGGQFVAVECRMFRKDRSHPLVLREYLDECKRNTQPWNQWPKRMLRHKAFIQAARLAFGLSGIEDDDEAERTASVIQPRRTIERGTIDVEAARAGVAVDPPGGQSLRPNAIASPAPQAPVEPKPVEPAMPPPTQAEPEPPPVRDVHGLFVDVTEPISAWKAKVLSIGKNPTPKNRALFEALHERPCGDLLDDKSPTVDMALKALISAGLGLQEKQGAAPRDPFQYAALLLEERGKRAKPAEAAELFGGNGPQDPA